jgi:A/G-specific adenine glycosylase
LGYPRRALRLHRAAVAIVDRHGGEVPGTYEELLTLPGIGDYTAAAVASFGFGAHHVVMDTNVRRVLSRVAAGVADLPPTVASRRLAESFVPDGADAPRWAVASMEVGALVCTARSPRCDACPISDECTWRAAGYPALAVPVRAAQPWHGTDRQCRGTLLALVRVAADPVPRGVLIASWSNPVQAERCLVGLVVDGLLHGDLALSLYEGELSATVPRPDGDGR